MAITFKAKQEIQKLKKLGLGKTEIAKKLKISRVTVYTYWDWQDPEAVQLKKPAAESVSEKTEELICPNCQQPLKFLKTDLQIRCPNCDELFNVIRENDNNDEKYNKPYKYSTKSPRRRGGINVKRLIFFFRAVFVILI